MPHWFSGLYVLQHTVRLDRVEAENHFLSPGVIKIYSTAYTRAHMRRDQTRQRANHYSPSVIARLNDALLPARMPSASSEVYGHNKLVSPPWGEELLGRARRAEAVPDRLLGHCHRRCRMVIFQRRTAATTFKVRFVGPELPMAAPSRIMTYN